MARSPSPPKRVVKRALDTTDKSVRGKALVARKRRPNEPELFDGTDPMLERVAPCLASLVDKPPSGGLWWHEIKWDGYRIVVHVRARQVRIETRNGHDWTDRFPAIVAAASKLPVRSAILDEEAVVLTEAGVSDFGALQAALGGRAGRNAASEVIFYAFDLLYLNGVDLRSGTLEQRRLALEEVIPGDHGALRLSEHLDGDGEALFRAACEHGLEGIVSKRRDQPYRSGRGTDWTKAKCAHIGRFTIVGYLQEGRKRRVGAVLLARDEGGELTYAGKAGAGLTETVASDLWHELEARRRPTKPCAGTPSPDTRRKARWVEPTLVAEIEYRGITADGRLRHPVFKGLR